MQFNNGDGLSLVNDIDFWVGTTNVSYPLVDKTRNVNNRYDQVVSLIMQADGMWEFDDNNYNDLPVGTTDLFTNQDNYEIAAGDVLDIMRVELKQPNGISIWLEPIDYQDRRGVAMTEWAKTPDIPQYYDKVGNSLVLYPTPNYSYAAGLKIYYKRNPLAFTTTDTTKEPGFARAFHRMLSIGAAIDYCIKNNLDKKMLKLLKEWDKMQNDLIDFYSMRSKDQKVNLRPLRERYGPMADYDGWDLSVDWRS